METFYQACLRTYDAFEHLAGVMVEGKATLAPPYHAIKNAHVEVAVDMDGNCAGARLLGKKESPTLTQVTEKSQSRTSTSVRPHLIVDTLGYVAPGLDKKNPYYEAYVQQMRDFAEFSQNEKIKAILAYVQKGTILDDLAENEALPMKGEKVDAKAFVRWTIVGSENPDLIWADRELMDQWIEYCSRPQEGDTVGVCMVTGEKQKLAKLFNKSILPGAANAKLISSDDKDEFTFRGIFDLPQDAFAVGALPAQKIFSALKWLIKNTSVSYNFGKAKDVSTYLVWDTKSICTVNPFISVFSQYAESKTFMNPKSYREELKKALLKSSDKSNPLFKAGDEENKNDGVTYLAKLDAATNGRASVCDFETFSSSDFKRRMLEWDDHFCWYHNGFGIQSPWLITVVSNAYGVERSVGEKRMMVADEAAVRLGMRELLDCKIHRKNVSKVLVRMLANNAAARTVHEKADPEVWKSILWCACSALNYYVYKTTGEDAINWGLDHHDRSFQYGRLLAILERAEADYYRSSDLPLRDTTAAKQMPMFRSCPKSVYERIYSHVNAAYLRRLKPAKANYYRGLINSVWKEIDAFPEADINKKLDPTYLLGYSLQLQAMTKKNDNEKEKEKSIA